MHDHKIPDEERAFLEEVITAAQGLYAAVGNPRPFAVIKAGLGKTLVLSLPGLGGSDAAKEQAINSVRHHSLRLASPMCAMVLETWSLTVGENTQRELDDLVRRGKGMGDHPDAREAVLIMIESELGRTAQKLTIDRRHEDMTQLIPDKEVGFDTWAELELRPQAQRMVDFHVRLLDRIDPDVIAWAAYMDEKYGDPRIEKELPPIDESLLPTTH